MDNVNKHGRRANERWYDKRDIFSLSTSEFKGFSDNESDVDVPNALESSEDEHGESKNEDEIEWSDRFHNIQISDFTQETGPVFPEALTPKKPRLRIVLT